MLTAAYNTQWKIILLFLIFESLNCWKPPYWLIFEDVRKWFRKIKTSSKMRNSFQSYIHRWFTSLNHFYSIEFSPCFNLIGTKLLKFISEGSLMNPLYWPYKRKYDIIKTVLIHSWDLNLMFIIEIDVGFIFGVHRKLELNIWASVWN